MAVDQQDVARLLVRCPDRPGIVAAISGFLADRSANIITSDQFSTDPEGGTFLMRMTVYMHGLRERAAFEDMFRREVAEPFGMDWRLWFVGDRRRVTLMVSRYDHCLVDLLWRWRRGELDIDVVQVISNHEHLRAEVEGLGVPYHHVPVTKDTKREAERAAADLIAGSDLVVLARYMQILTGDFLRDVDCPVINIHHSFLPAFAGAGPYERAQERGVKLIGATAHYVTEDLDAGPIIEQDVLRVNHRYTAADLERVGRDIERVVLARAVRSHLDDRVLIDGNRTVVFGS
ncbi:MAG: formyltetrahydrofolate deformylase [Solirubrobacterales bacterium]|nr:formyltetrahydrofolate deformylase [Solirubrobacterales bacterium]